VNLSGGGNPVSDRLIEVGVKLEFDGWRCVSRRSRANRQRCVHLWRALYDAWLAHNVLVVRGQDLGIEQFLAYSGLFGRLKPHRVRRTRHPEYPETHCRRS
jgi:Taurine catabolism dioxygenase TauD, TfdA family